MPGKPAAPVFEEWVPQDERDFYYCWAGLCPRRTNQQSLDFLDDHKLAIKNRGVSWAAGDQAHQHIPARPGRPSPDWQRHPPYDVSQDFVEPAGSAEPAGGGGGNDGGSGDGAGPAAGRAPPGRAAPQPSSSDGRGRGGAGGAAHLRQHPEVCDMLPAAGSALPPPPCCWKAWRGMLAALLLSHSAHLPGTTPAATGPTRLCSPLPAPVLAP